MKQEMLISYCPGLTFSGWTLQCAELDASRRAKLQMVIAIKVPAANVGPRTEALENCKKHKRAHKRDGGSAGWRAPCRSIALHLFYDASISGELNYIRTLRVSHGAQIVQAVSDSRDFHSQPTRSAGNS